MDSPEAPISHHWLDSTHITFGVVTAGLVLGGVKLEALALQRPRARPASLEHRDRPARFDRACALSWNPTGNLSLQASWAHLVSPEQLEPGRESAPAGRRARSTPGASAATTGGPTTLAWGRRDGDDAFALESAAGLGLWTLFGRAERTENDELAAGRAAPPTMSARSRSGAIRDFRVAPHVRLGLGGLYAFNFVPAPLRASYGGNPGGAMAFIRLRVDYGPRRDAMNAPYVRLGITLGLGAVRHVPRPVRDDRRARRPVSLSAWPASR